MTPKDKMFRFRLTEEEFQRLEDEAKKAGFLNMSEYARYMILGDGSIIRGIDEKTDAILKKLEEKIIGRHVLAKTR